METLGSITVGEAAQLLIVKQLPGGAAAWS